MTPKEVLENYWRIECTRNVDDILGCYVPDAVFVAPGFDRLEGHAEIRRFYQTSVDRFPFLAVDIVGAVEADDHAAVEWRAEFRDKAGRRFGSAGVNVVRTVGDKLREVHVYFDPSELDHPLGGAAST